MLLRAISVLVLVLSCFSATPAAAQSSSDKTDTIRGVVINRVTNEPIARSLVSSPDHRFATLTNAEGRFEFTFPKTEPAADSGADSSIARFRRQPAGPNRPYALMAVKPGFLPDPNGSQNLASESRDMTLTLVPESLIVGTVTLPTSEAPDSISLQIFRRQVQDGRAQWLPAGGAQSRSDGQFRFAGLAAGTYKLLTQELLDRDPLTFSPLGPLFGYPPVYYQSAPDFASASTIQLTAGQTVQVNVSLVRQPYYRVKVPVLDAPTNGLNVNVYAGERGPGFSLGYNNEEHAIEGLLPNGSYTIDAVAFGPNGAFGRQTIHIKGGAVNGPSLAMVPNASIPVSVKEEFTSADHTVSMSWNINGRNMVLKGPRRYLNVSLEPADDFRMQGGASLRVPTGPGDEALVIEGATAGRYWVRVSSSRGYAASVRSGNLDLLHEPLVLGVGGAASPIEITMRDDVAEITGLVEGLGSGGGKEDGTTSFGGLVGQAGARVYCIPLPDSSGQFNEIYVSPDGSFQAMGLAPGEYRLLAIDRVQPELEFRNPEAMQPYDSKGVVVHLVGGQKEHVQLPLISAKEE